MDISQRVRLSPSSGPTRAATPVATAEAGDVVVTIPLENYRSAPVEPLNAKSVIDTNNSPQRDTPGYGPRRNAELRKDRAVVNRYAETRRSF
jgi:hypothetical protein